MQLKWGARTSLIALGYALSGCSAGAFGRDERPNSWPHLPVETGVEAGSLAPLSARRTAGLGNESQADAAPPSQAVASYDDVLRASWSNQDGPNAGQDQFAVWITHPTLPVPSFVEITRLDTGRTILARVAARAAASSGTTIILSDGAARQLMLGPSGRAAFRVRRVNPPEQDKAALRMGRAAVDRLDTPELLLTILRKKADALPGGLAVRAAQTRKTGQTRATTALKSAHPYGHAPYLASNPQEIGADYGADPAPLARPSPSAWAANGPALNGGWFVQLIALSSAQRARQVAQAVGGHVVPAGAVYRVRKGPYSSDAQARAALGPLAAKGYPDARITR